VRNIADSNSFLVSYLDIIRRATTNFDIIGYKELVRTVADLLKSDPEFTKLRPDLTGTDPDDAFSIVPYEKGCLFLFFLESRVAGSIDAMKGWLHSLYSTFRTLSYTSEQMRNHCEEYFKKQVSALKVITWKKM